jgi:KDO2-lipid IV(A) lauroyltransferase
MSLFINAFANILGFLTSKLPRQWLRKSGAWLGFLWFDVFQFRKKIVLDNLEIAFPEWPLEKKLEVGRQSVYNLGYNATELFTVPFIDENWMKKNNVFEGYENIEKARALGKGMLFLSLHLGNGDLGASLIVLQGQELFLITKRFKTK